MPNTPPTAPIHPRWRRAVGSSTNVSRQFPSQLLLFPVLDFRLWAVRSHAVSGGRFCFAHRLASTAASITEEPLETTAAPGQEQRRMQQIYNFEIGIAGFCHSALKRFNPCSELPTDLDDAAASFPH